jgi:predicted ATPase
MCANDFGPGHIELPIVTKTGGPSERAECGYRSERKRQIKPVSSAPASGRHSTKPRHTFIGLRRGLQSTLWAGPEITSRKVRPGEYPVQGTARNKPVRLQLGFAADDFSYLIDLGLPPQAPDSPSAFLLDPEIKRELIWHGVRVRSDDGNWNVIASDLFLFESVMTQIADPRNAPETLVLRESIRAWRFYDHFRADADAPARQPQIGARTPILGNDGADLAAAIQTISEIGDREELDAAVTDAFPGSALSVQNNDGRFQLFMQQHGLLRPMSAAELFDGTLRYLLWIAALLAPRPPALMILIEPETSLHPDLVGALARLIAQGGRKSQIVVVKHSAKLIAALADQPACHSITLEKSFGETVISGRGPMGLPSWNWPAR